MEEFIKILKILDKYNVPFENIYTHAGNLAIIVPYSEFSKRDKDILEDFGFTSNEEDIHIYLNI